jgi:hypothetical protein
VTRLTTRASSCDKTYHGGRVSSHGALDVDESIESRDDKRAANPQDSTSGTSGLNLNIVNAGRQIDFLDN